jgi:hypothetical protein
MTTIVLQYSTGDTHVDRLIQNVIAQFERAFPARIAGYYVEGSYADQTAVATSDLDLTLVFRERFATTGERERAQRLVATCKGLSTLELDVTLVEEVQLRQQVDPLFKLGARLLYGQDTRDTMPLVPITQWAKQRMHAAYWLMINVLQRPQPVQAPIAFPQPMAPFYGYAARMMKLADGSEVPTTRNLVRVTGWIATARIAYEARQYIIRKRACAPAYRRLIGDEWADLLAQIDQRCRIAWQYRIPNTVAEQQELCMILNRTLAFENHFLTRYRRFLLFELGSGDPSARYDALSLLGRTFFADPEIVEVVRQLAHADDPRVQSAAQQLEAHFML